MRLRWMVCAGLTALLATLVWSGCDGHACTAVHYDAGLRVWFRGPNGMPLPAITPEIVLHVDGEVYTLVCGRLEPAGPFQCEEAEGTGDHRIASEELSSSAFSLRIWRIENGDELGPREVRIEAVSGDGPLVDQTFTPSYETDEPNGQGCGRVDHVVEETVVIDVGE